MVGGPRDADRGERLHGVRHQRQRAQRLHGQGVRRGAQPRQDEHRQSGDRHMERRHRKLADRLVLVRHGGGRQHGIDREAGEIGRFGRHELPAFLQPRLPRLAVHIHLRAPRRRAHLLLHAERRRAGERAVRDERVLHHRGLRRRHHGGEHVSHRHERRRHARRPDHAYVRRADRRHRRAQRAGRAEARRCRQSSGRRDDWPVCGGPGERGRQNPAGRRHAVADLRHRAYGLSIPDEGLLHVRHEGFVAKRRRRQRRQPRQRHVLHQRGLRTGRL